MRKKHILPIESQIACDLCHGGQALAVAVVNGSILLLGGAQTHTYQCHEVSLSHERYLELVWDLVQEDVVEGSEHLLVEGDVLLVKIVLVREFV
jgi:hypothetical protein